MVLPAVPVPIEIVLALLPVPKLSAPVVPESSVKAVPAAVEIVDAPPKVRLPDDNAGIWLPVGVCEGTNPSTDPELMANPDETICGRGLSVSKVTPTHEDATCAATSTFIYTVSLS